MTPTLPWTLIEDLDQDDPWCEVEIAPHTWLSLHYKTGKYALDVGLEGYSLLSGEISVREIGEMQSEVEGVFLEYLKNHIDDALKLRRILEGDPE